MGDCVHAFELVLDEGELRKWCWKCGADAPLTDDEVREALGE